MATLNTYIFERYIYVSNNTKELKLLFHGNNGYAVAPQCYIERTLPILFFYEVRPSPTDTPARETWFGAPH